MKGQGMFRRIADRFNRATGKDVTHPDPVLRNPYEAKPRKPAKKKAKRELSCDPGTIVYHDKLVRHFGRRKADKYGLDIQKRNRERLPSEQDFLDNPPWRYLQ